MYDNDGALSAAFKDFIPEFIKLTQSNNDLIVYNSLNLLGLFAYNSDNYIEILFENNILQYLIYLY